ncbi:microcompartments protein [Alkaliphilus metalliredigens QYMF]|uniref:Microcompartments protein n=1 Tax=Alkaliphilus metalliredigens (strain QYMF) TaxID=293826 RepID=A6TJX3_ALKMQ|nr:BMC domain-containing protein [Alkaliphilus metalliredigens]ABR46491.1 microcompartments protein [Alkaliphilus metalliredigens QYMF]
MSNNALGLLETYGYTPSIVALDAALKTANVTLKDFQITGGGLVTMMVEGDVAAVQAAIEAGNIAAETIGRVISQHVIPRPDIGLKSLLQSHEGKNKQPVEGPVSISLDEESQELEEKEATQELEEAPSQKLEEVEIQNKSENPGNHHNGKEIKIRSKKDLNRMKVVELRKMARGLDGFSMEAKTIKFANKSELVAALLSHFRMEVE